MADCHVLCHHLRPCHGSKKEYVDEGTRKVQSGMEGYNGKDGDLLFLRRYGGDGK